LTLLIEEPVQRKIWSYQKGNKKPQFEKEQTTQ